jgi:hypothetical protein
VTDGYDDPHLGRSYSSFPRPPLDGRGKENTVGREASSCSRRFHLGSQTPAGNVLPGESTTNAAFASALPSGVFVDGETSFSAVN